jgi:hypothetical protein
MPPARYRPAAVSHAVVDQHIANSTKRTAQLAARPVEKASGGAQAFVVPVLHIPLTPNRRLPVCLGSSTCETGASGQFISGRSTAGRFRVGLPWSRRSTRLYGSDGSIERAGAGMNMLRTPRHVAPPSRPERHPWQLLQSAADAGGATGRRR